MSKTRAGHFVELGDKDAAKIATYTNGWNYIKGNCTDPVALDEFALQAMTIAAVASQMATRAEQLAESLLEEMED